MIERNFFGHPHPRKSVFPGRQDLISLTILTLITLLSKFTLCTASRSVVLRMIPFGLGDVKVWIGPIRLRVTSHAPGLPAFCSIFEAAARISSTCDSLNETLT